MREHSKDRTWWQTRRRVLGTLAGTGIATMAGCLEGDPDDDDDPGVADDDNGVDDGDPPDDAEMTFWLGRDFPDEMQFNGFSPEPGFPEEWGGGLMYGYLLGVVKEDFPEWGVLPLDGLLVEDFDRTPYLEEGETMDFVLRDDIYWHDGEPVTAEDMVDAATINLDQQPAIGWQDWFDGAEVIDDRTFGFVARHDGWVRDSYLTLRGTWPYYGSSTYREFAERFHDATDDEEREEITADLGAFNDTEGVGLGPYQLGQITETAIILEQFEDYPEEYKSNVSTIRLERAEDERVPVEAGTFDGFGTRDGWLMDENNHPPADREPEYRFDDHDITGGWSLQFNVTTEPWSNMRVRQAVAHLLNRDSITLDTLPPDPDPDVARGMTLATLTGHHDETIEAHLGYDVPEDLTEVDEIGPFPTYGPNESREEVAEEILLDEGFTKEDDFWYDANGDRMEASILTGATFEPWAQGAHGQFQRFGIDSTIDQRPESDFWAATPGSPPDDEIDEYDMVMQNWGFGVPIRAFRDDYHGFRAWGSGRSLVSNEGTQAEPEVIVEVPYPVGEPDGDLEEVNVSELIEVVATTADEDEQREASIELSWVSSMLVDRIPLYRMAYHFVICHDEWEWPEAGSRTDLRLAPAAHNISFVWGDVNAK